MTVKKPKKSRTSRDFLLPIIIIFVLLLTGIIVYKIASPIVEKTRYQTYLNDLLLTVNDSKGTDEVVFEYDGKTYPLSDDYVGYIYYMLNNISMGLSTNDNPEPVITVRFPDSSELAFSETEILAGSRKGRMGLFASFTNNKGKTYKYYTDLYYLRSFEDIFKEAVPDAFND